MNDYFKSTINLTLTLSLTESPCTDRPGCDTPYLQYKHTIIITVPIVEQKIRKKTKIRHLSLLTT